MSAARRRQLRQLLNEAPTTAEFLNDVLGAVEALYADDDCPEGFRLLEEAIEAFEDDGTDEGHGTADDEDDDETEDDEEEE